MAEKIDAQDNTIRQLNRKLKEHRGNSPIDVPPSRNYVIIK